MTKRELQDSIVLTNNVSVTVYASTFTAGYDHANIDIQDHGVDIHTIHGTLTLYNQSIAKAATNTKIKAVSIDMV